MKSVVARIDVRLMLSLGAGLIVPTAIAVDLFVTPYPVKPVLAIALLALAALHIRAVPWEVALGCLILLILFVPVRRFVFPGNLPFQPEPYRALAGVVLVGWGFSLLADSRVRLRRSGYEGPLLLVVAAVLASLSANGDRVAELDTRVVKSLIFFLTFVLILYLVVSVVRTRAAVLVLLKSLTIGGALVAATAVVEFRTGFNVYDRAASYVPYVASVDPASTGLAREGSTRAYASAQHPIALGVALAMIVPLALYFAYTGRRRWWWAAAALVLLAGTLSTVSRTPIVALAVVTVVFLWLRPRLTSRFLPAVIPLVVAIYFAVPGAAGAIKAAFFPEEGLLAEQRLTFALPSDVPTWCNTAARLADVGPALDDVSRKPLLGYGYRTRITTGESGSNACILDNQWLSTLLETGALGVLGWAWLFLRFMRRGVRQAKQDASADGLLSVSLVASVAAFAVSMLFFDAFSFIQATFLLFVLLGLGSVLQGSPAPLTVAVAKGMRPAEGLPSPGR